jgi:prevent-host-death family protein
MDRVGVREIRQNISVYLRRVELGEAFTVTDHGRPVALLTPLPRDDDPLAALIAAGKVIPARRRLEDLPPPIKLPPGSPTLSQILQEMRDEDDR